MNRNQKRNEEIVGSLKQGVPALELAERFRMSVARVGAIQAEAVARVEALGRARLVQAQMRAADDLDRRWPIEMVMTVLDLDLKSLNCLERHLRDGGKTDASLRDLLDCLVRDVDDSADFHAMMPNFWRKGLGQITFAAVAAGFNRANLGKAFRQEWTRRRKKAAKRLVRPQLGRSLACILCCGGPPRGFR